MRQLFKYLVILASVSLLWIQTAAAGHDHSHHINTAAEDCITCKLTESGHDKAIVESKQSPSFQFSNYQEQEIIEYSLPLVVWNHSHSRAPPAS